MEWDTRGAAILAEDGTSFFEQKDVEMPAFWSQTATNVVVSKYFRGPLGGASHREGRARVVRQMIGRVAETITGWGVKDGYFDDEEEARRSRTS